MDQKSSLEILRRSMDDRGRNAYIPEFVEERGSYLAMMPVQTNVGSCHMQASVKHDGTMMLMFFHAPDIPEDYGTYLQEAFDALDVESGPFEVEIEEMECVSGYYHVPGWALEGDGIRFGEILDRCFSQVRDLMEELYEQLAQLLPFDPVESIWKIRDVFRENQLPFDMAVGWGEWSILSFAFAKECAVIFTDDCSGVLQITAERELSQEVWNRLIIRLDLIGVQCTVVRMNLKEEAKSFVDCRFDLDDLEEQQLESLLLGMKEILSEALA